jgi:hypothetical protein
MTLDFLDAAFVTRWQASLSPAMPVPPAVAAAEADGVAAPPAAETTPFVATAATVEPTAADDFVGRLLAAARTEWEALADEVIAARDRGRRAIAIVACERAAGCSTLAAGLVRVLRGRGRDAVECSAVAIASAGAPHDKRIVIVDGGVWFPPGRINRQRLLVSSCGCDAAILVVRSGHRPPAAWSTSLEAIGVEPLGEVVSFVPTTVGSQP